jgi:plastocyanin
MEAQNFFVQAGALGTGNIEILAFAPQSIQIHRGDTVTWFINSFHNVRFANGPAEMVIVADVNGQPMPQLDPAIAYPTINSGDTYTGGELGSGLPDPTSPNKSFSLVMDVEPGVYSYVCDIHAGMVGLINVVADTETIPGAAEVALQGASELRAAIDAATPALLELETIAAAPADNGVQVQVGNGGTGRATVNQFFPLAATITAGQSVTWNIPADSVEPHTVSWPITRGQDFVPVPVEEGKPPVLVMGPSVLPMTESGASVNAGDDFSSGFFLPGQSFTLTFNEPGVYPYTCNIHPGMNGVVVVEPAA